MSPYIPVVSDLLKLIGEAVVDKDKRNELTQRALEVNAELTKTIIGTTTVPWIDAIVKLVYALVALATPIGSALAFAFNLYCKYKQIPLDTATEAVTLGGFPAWAGYRRVEKAKGVSIPRSGPPR